MKHIYKFIFALFLFPLSAIAQSNYKPGYVVSLKGDTLQGYIDYKEWERNPESIDFKSTLSGAPAESFTAKNARGFAVNGLEYFKRFVVRISRDQVELSNVKQGADTSSITDAVFLRVLTLGKNISLFSYTDKIKTRYYILDGTAGQPQELVYRIYYSAENSTLLQTENRFRIQLEYLAQKYHINNSGLETQISSSAYLEGDILKIAQGINGETAKQFTPKSRLGTRWYGGIGITNNNLSFIGVIQYANNSSTFPKIAAGFDLFLNKNTQKLFFRAELSLSGNAHSFSFGPDATGYSSSLSKVVQHNVTISPQVVYNLYNSDQFKFFFGAGISFNLSFYNKYHFTDDVSGVTIVTNQFPILPAKRLSFPLKTGMILNNRIEVYVGYTLITSLIDNYQAFTGKVYEYQAGINYLLSVK
jgi:hypothetical protein